MAAGRSRVETAVMRQRMESRVHEEKLALRASAKERLAALSVAERAERSWRIVRRIVGSPVWGEASRVLLFAPLPVEPDVDLLWLAGALLGKGVAYPRVEGSMIRLYYIDGLDELEPTRWGLREPPPRAARQATLEAFQIALVPGLAFDAAGGRLGRGGGFYDRLLAERTLKTRLVGVGFAFQRIDGALPLAAHDMRLDEICTD